MSAPRIPGPSTHRCFSRCSTARYCAVLYPLFRQGLISPDDAAAGLLRVALDSTLTGRTGLYYERGRLAEPGAVGLDDDSARRLWSVTEELIGLDAADR